LEIFNILISITPGRVMDESAPVERDAAGSGARQNDLLELLTVDGRRTTRPRVRLRVNMPGRANQVLGRYDPSGGGGGEDNIFLTFARPYPKNGKRPLLFTFVPVISSTAAEPELLDAAADHCLTKTDDEAASASAATAATCFIRTYHGTYLTIDPPRPKSLLFGERFETPRCAGGREALTSELRLYHPPRKDTAISAAELMAALPCTISIKSPHGKFLSAQWNHKIEWNRGNVAAWEEVTVIAVPGEEGKIALKSAHGKFLSADADGSLEWDRDNISDWEEFELIDPRQEAVDAAAAARAEPSALEQRLPSGSVIALISAEGLVLSAGNDGDVHAEAPPVGRSLNVSDSAALVVGWTANGCLSLQRMACRRFLSTTDPSSLADGGAVRAINVAAATDNELFTPTVVQVRSSDDFDRSSFFEAVDEMRCDVDEEEEDADVDHLWVSAVSLRAQHPGLPLLSATHGLKASDARSVVRCTATPLQHVSQAFRIVLLRHADGRVADADQPEGRSIISESGGARFVDLFEDGPPEPPSPSRYPFKLAEILGMGFEAASAVDILHATGGNIEAAVNRLVARAEAKGSGGAADEACSATATADRAAARAEDFDHMPACGPCRILAWGGSGDEETQRSLPDARDPMHIATSVLLGELTIDESGWLVVKPMGRGGGESSEDAGSSNALGRIGNRLRQRLGSRSASMTDEDRGAGIFARLIGGIESPDGGSERAAEFYSGSVWWCAQVNPDAGVCFRDGDAVTLKHLYTYKYATGLDGRLRGDPFNEAESLDRLLERDDEASGEFSAAAGRSIRLKQSRVTQREYYKLESERRASMVVQQKAANAVALDAMGLGPVVSNRAHSTRMPSDDASLKDGSESLRDRSFTIDDLLQGPCDRLRRASVTRRLRDVEGKLGRGSRAWAAERRALAAQSSARLVRLDAVVGKLGRVLSKRARDKMQLKKLTAGYRVLQEMQEREEKEVVELRAAMRVADKRRELEQSELESMRVQLGAVTSRLKDVTAKEVLLASERDNVVSELQSKLELLESSMLQAQMWQGKCEELQQQQQEEKDQPVKSEASLSAAPSPLVEAVAPCAVARQPSHEAQLEHVMEWAAATADAYNQEELAMADASAGDAKEATTEEEEEEAYPLHAEFGAKEAFLVWLRTQQARKLAKLGVQRERQRLVEFYAEHNPGKLDAVDTLLESHGGSEESLAALWAQLRAKYE
tara:strand:- start:39 stop:3683 length:3645 start_codon:yes stop_codon:yes gene_type:complete